MAINPFQLQRQNLGSQLFGSASAFGQQSSGFLQSRGTFDPNLQEAQKQMAFQQAIEALSMGLTDLSGKEAMFGENQRQFDLGFGLQQQQFGENQRQFDIQQAFQQQQFDYQRHMAGKGPNIFDWVTGIAGAAGGFGSLLGALGGGNSGQDWFAKFLQARQIEDMDTSGWYK